MLYLKVYLCYYIDVCKCFGWSKLLKVFDDLDFDGLDWNCFVMDWEKFIELYELMMLLLKVDIDNVWVMLLKWLDEYYLKYCDLFVYWLDCEGVL